MEGDQLRKVSRHDPRDFYPRPPGGGRPPRPPSFVTVPEFLSTPSGWRATLHQQGGGGKSFYFYPRPPGGGRLVTVTIMCAPRHNFYPRPPGGGRHKDTKSIHTNGDFYPRPPGGGRQQAAKNCLSARRISIHALRVEGDYDTGLPRGCPPISIHALRVEGDVTVNGGDAMNMIDFYPRPPGGGRRRLLARRG